MAGIFLKQLLIENYKCFAEQELNFAVPDGVTQGSGLNVLIGENGNGKTSILEAINFLTQSSFSTLNKLQINDFTDYEKPINVRGYTNDFSCKSTIDYFKGWTFNCYGIEFTAKSRDTKARGKILSPAFETQNRFMFHENYIKGEKGVTDTPTAVDGRDKQFNNASINDAEINIFYFDKNRSRHLSTGNYKTTFESICEDMNWKFIKNLSKSTQVEFEKKISGGYFEDAINVAQKGTGKKLATDLSDFFENEIFKNLQIDLLEHLHPFNNAFFSLRAANKLSQIKMKDLGSGVEMVLALILLKNIANESKGSIIYLIDEPELHLHPKAQEQLAGLLLDESKDKQIFISTHSPYMFSKVLDSSCKTILFKRDKLNKLTITTDTEVKKLFPWSPSWGEINFKAYGLATSEFHNELYGVAQKYAPEALEKLAKTKTWHNVKTGKDLSVSLPEYVRHSIHHPENTINPIVDDEENRASIELLITICEAIPASAFDTE